MPQATCPYFMWDYDLSDEDLHQILRGEDEQAKIWDMTRLLESARYEGVWNFISLEELLVIFPMLQRKPQVRAAWEYALSVWGQATDYDPNFALQDRFVPH